MEDEDITQKQQQTAGQTAQAAPAQTASSAPAAASPATAARATAAQGTATGAGTAPAKIEPEAGMTALSGRQVNTAANPGAAPKEILPAGVWNPNGPSWGGRRYNNYAEVIDAMNPGWKPRTREEIEEEKKKRKRAAMWAAIGDGVSALSNLFFTTRGAPHSFDASKSMSAALQQRWEKQDAERDKNRQAYLNAYLQAAGLDDTRARADRDYQHTIERDKVGDEWRKMEFNYKQANDKRDFDYKAGQDKIANDQRQQGIDLQKDSLEETKRSNRVSEAIAWKNASRPHGGASATAQGVEFYIGNGQKVTLGKGAYHTGNMAAVFDKLPPSIQIRYMEPVNPLAGETGGRPYKVNGKVQYYKLPDSDQMIQAIGQNCERPEVAAALKNIGKVSGAGGGKGGNSLGVGKGK